MLTNNEAFSFFPPAVKNSFYSHFPGTMAAAGGGPFQQEDNASWKCHVRVAVHRPGNVGWMMTGEDGGVMVQEAPSWRGSENIWSLIVVCILQYL